MEKPTLFFEPLVWDKIWHFIHKSTVEVSGLGIIDIVDGFMVVTDVFVPKQTNTSTSTEFDSEDLNRFYFKYRTQSTKLRFWWHSHVNMSVFWSADDMEAMRKLGKDSYVVSTVFNKKGEHRSAIYMEKPIPMFIDEIGVSLVKAAVSPELIAEWDKIYEEKCKVEIYQPPLYLTPGASTTWDPIDAETKREIDGMLEWYISDGYSDELIRKYMMDDYGPEGVRYARDRVPQLRISSFKDVETTCHQ